MADELVAACDPSIELCEPEPYPFKNTIELDYFTPNKTVAYLSFINLVLPNLFYYLWVRRNRSTAEQAAWEAQVWYDLGWEWIVGTSNVIWGVPAFLWTMEIIFGATFFQFLLLGWWSAVQPFFGPVLGFVSAIMMITPQALDDWDSSWDDYFTRAEIYIVSITYMICVSISTYIFLKNSAFALYHYDEILQERYEEELQFGPPEKEEDIPQELIDDTGDEIIVVA